MASATTRPQGLPATWRRHGTLVLGGLAAVLLLLLFQQVVRGALEQGDARRKATALRADTVWRCQQLRDPRLQVQCLSPVTPAP